MEQHIVALPRENTTRQDDHDERMTDRKSVDPSENLLAFDEDSENVYAKKRKMPKIISFPPHRSNLKHTLHT